MPLPILSCPQSSTLPPMKSLTTSSVSLLPKGKSSWSMSPLTQSSMNESPTQPCTMMTPPSPRLSSSFKTMFSSNNSSHASQSHIFQYRLPRPLTLPYLLPEPPYLSCWWTGDLTDFWGCSLETTSPQYSEPLSFHYQRSNGKCIMAPMTQCREQCRLARRMVACLLTPEPIPAPLTLPEPPPQLNPFPLLILPSTLFPNWPDKPTPSLVALEPPPFPRGNDIVVTLHWLNAAGEGLTNKVLLEWALDMLHSLEDWRWLWSPEPATTPSPSPTPNQPLPPWYGAFSANPPNMFTPSVQSMYAPSVEPLLLVTPNAPALCVPALSAENSVM